jgi:hypothetical protein
VLTDVNTPQFTGFKKANDYFFRLIVIRDASLTTDNSGKHVEYDFYACV